VTKLPTFRIRSCANWNSADLNFIQLPNIKFIVTMFGVVLALVAVLIWITATGLQFMPAAG